MKTKKWQVVTISSLAVIVVEVVLFFLLTLPAMRTNSLFKALESGDATEARDIYGKLSSGKQSKVREKLGDFGTYQVNEYINGKLEYDKLSKQLEAASKLDKKKCPEIMEEYIGKASSVELVNIFETASKDYLVNEDYYSDTFEDCSDRFSEIYYSMDNSDMADDELEACIQSKQDAFDAGDLEIDEYKAYANAGTYLFSYGTEAYDIASDMSDKAYYIGVYQEDLDEAQEYYDNEEYFECIEYCDDELEWSFYSDEDETGYKAKFQTLRDDAYETGKTYYLDKAESLINSGDTYGGEEILTKMDEVYGDDVDTSAVWALTRAAWMTAYVDFMGDWESHIRADVVSGVKVGNYDDPSTVNVDDYLPYDIYLYDFDDNGVPEMMLRTYDYRYYIYTYDGSNVVFTGLLSLVSLTEKPRLLTEPISMPENMVQGYELLEFANNAWTVVEYYITDGVTYEVNGESVSMETAEEMHNRFEDMQTSEYIDYDSIDNYEDFIYSYGQ